jgi:hypothetical protein
MSRKQKVKPGAVIPLRVPVDMQDSVRRVAESEGLSEADIMRMAISRGLPVLEKLFSKSQKTAA